MANKKPVTKKSTVETSSTTVVASTTESSPSTVATSPVHASPVDASTASVVVAPASVVQSVVQSAADTVVSVSTATDVEPKAHRSFEEVMEECVRQAQVQVASNRTLVSTIREASKCHEREMREALKSSKRSRKQVDGVKKPLTGFAKPCRISDELADFLHHVANNADVVRGMEMSRTEVTRRLNEYFVKNDLRDSTDKRTILFEKDPKLVALFGSGVTKGTKLTYFNLQSALKDQFIKQAPAMATTSAPVAVTSTPSASLSTPASKK